VPDELTGYQRSTETRTFETDRTGLSWRPARRRFARSISPPFALFVLFAIPELLRAWRWGLSEYGPFCFMDELLYRLNAESISGTLPPLCESGPLPHLRFPGRLGSKERTGLV
jgi:hypothetical protein